MASEQPAPRGALFLRNVFWSWAGVGVNIVYAFVITRYIIRGLGDESFGLWMLASSLAEYYWLVDLGFRSATLKYVAHYRATGDLPRVNEVLNTVLLYSVPVGVTLLVGTWLGAPALARFLRIQDPVFPWLVLLVVGAWVMGSQFNVFTASLEAFQRFDITNKIGAIAVAVRAVLISGALWFGQGVLALAIITLTAQLLLHLLSAIACYREFPELRLSPRLASRAMFRQLIGYGSHSVVSSLAARLLNQSTPLLIKYFLPARFVGYYATPARLLDYIVEAIARVGMVSNAKAAQLIATGEQQALRDLSVYVNRYSLTLFLPLTVFLAFYGHPLLAVWINPGFAAESAGVLLALLAGQTIANAAQYNSGSILFGMGRHQLYAWLLLAESLLVAAGALAILPVYGIAGAAWVSSLAMLLNRGLITAWLLSRNLGVNYFWFLGQVYRPLLAALPLAGALWILRHYLPGNSWGQLILAGLLSGLIYAPFALPFLRREHRDLLIELLRRKFRGSGDPASRHA